MKQALVFATGQLMDIVTTLVGFKVGCFEMNPMGANLLLKAFVTLIVTVLLIRLKFKLAWLVVFVAWLVVPWNILNIIAELVTK